MRLIAVRHGETEWNVESREIGQLDSALTARGVEQATALARRLSRMSISRLYSSDLGRALRTADIIGAMCKVQVIPDAGLRERNMGLFQGLTRAEIGARFPKEWEAHQRVGFYETIPDGETAAERRDRGVRALTVIAERHETETVVAVTHAGILTGFLESVLDLPLSGERRFKKENASYNAFEFANGRWSLETWNDVSHLSVAVDSVPDRGA